MITLDSILTNYLESYLQDCFFSMPAIIVGVRDREQLKVDVKPLVNRNYKDGSSPDLPVLYSVPLLMPATMSSALTLDFNIGDTVMLMFAQRDIDEFKSGTKESHSPNTNRWCDINDAVAILGFNPFNLSANLASRRTLPHNAGDVVLTHNIGKANECEVRLTKQGNISLTGNKVDINTKAGLFINNMPYALHTHTYTELGVQLQTTPPTGQT